ncbi:multiple sugar transport system permease protein [Pullulanibacillus pueri]|uniref:Sugar ABC transporter permease n=1 Tax=Pullulanibacillus pueri TaxID=1437324 RepID=A0A8J2ZV30_9BACL|nr:sugar ABC transporter permease [Pullulanibacillus pueri]MBM7680829.1 multiple sugar transport system permease protein [Pullulanibacillus pueri]GGH78494.1 sugar ABC transporter permease [Pullulanibacillus pueri]
MYKLKSKATPLFFIGPAVLLLVIFSVVPILISIGISFTDMNLIGLANWAQIKFVGIENYIDLFTDKVFIKSIGNTLFYVIIGVPLAVISSFVIALLLNQINKWLSATFRIIYYMPSITNIVAIAVVWGFLYNQDYGLFNYILSVFHIDGVAWLENPHIAKLSLILMAVWKSNGVSMLIFLAALQSIPRSQYEAADIDGASRWQKLIYITIPAMSFATFFVTVTTLIGWLQFFEEPFVMTEGGPLDSTNSMALFIYQEGFQFNEFGYGAAASVVLFAVIILATILQFKLRKSE